MKSKRCAEGPGRGRSADFSPGKVIACHYHYTAKIRKASDISKSFCERGGNSAASGSASVPLDGCPVAEIRGVVRGRHDLWRVNSAGAARVLNGHSMDDAGRPRCGLRVSEPDEQQPSIGARTGGRALVKGEDAGRLLSRLQLCWTGQTSGALAWVVGCRHTPLPGRQEGRGRWTEAVRYSFISSSFSLSSSWNTHVVFLYSQSK